MTTIFPDGFNSLEVELPDNNVLPVIAAVLQHYIDTRDYPDNSVVREYVARSGRNELGINVTLTAEVYTVVADGNHYTVATDWRPHNLVVHARINGEPTAVQVVAHPLGWQLATGGRAADVRILTPRAAELLGLIPEKEPPNMSKFLLSPMPGLLVRLNVAEGEKVQVGQELAVVEAMKMENSLRAQQDGIVAKCLAEASQNLVAEQPILEFE